MRTTAILSALGFLAAAPLAAAVDVDAPKLFVQLDANADGRLSGDEADRKHARLFDRLLRTADSDSDGQLDAEEFAAGLTPLRVEKQLVQKQGSRVPGADALIILLAKMDANGDRQLEADEIPSAYRDAFATMLQRADADKNGRLDPREIAQGSPQLGLIAQRTANRLGLDVAAELAQLAPERRQAMEQMDAYPRPMEMMADPAQAAELFARLDADGDKLLSAAEAPEGLARLLTRADRDGDGQLSEREFLDVARRMAGGQEANRPAAGRQNPRQLLGRFDRDGDSRLSRDEAPPRLDAAFDRLDEDGDGALSRQELQRAAGGRPNRAPNRRPNSADGVQE